MESSRAPEQQTSGGHAEPEAAEHGLAYPAIEDKEPNAAEVGPDLEEYSLRAGK